MYEYDYVKFKCKSTGWGGFAGVVYSIEGFIPSKQRATGHIQELDLVFEKKIK